MPAISFRVNPEYAKISEIVPGLYICGVSSLSNTLMARYEITHIINATTEVPNLKCLGDIQRSKLWLDDTPQTYIYPHLELQSDQIQAIIHDGGRVLVHCVSGVSRSAAICLAFLTKFRCRSLRDAYHLMARRRPMVRPNIGFWRQLIAFEQSVKQTHGSVRLVRDEAQEYALLPDVYLKDAIPEESEPRKENAQGKYQASTRTRTNSTSKIKFQPVLEPLSELVEVGAS